MYVPSDFCQVEACWVTGASDEAPYLLDRPVKFTVNDKSERAPAPTEAADGEAEMSADDVARWRGKSAKVMLMGGANPHVLYATDDRDCEAAGPRAPRAPAPQQRTPLRPP